MHLYKIIGKVLGVDPTALNDESNAQNTPKWDSLRHIELVIELEESFGVTIPPAAIADLYSDTDSVLAYLDANAAT